MRHLRDDQALGWGGMRRWFEDPNIRYQAEARAYQVEIDYARSIGDHDAVEQLTRLLEAERLNIFGGGG